MNEFKFKKLNNFTFFELFTPYRFYDVKLSFYDSVKVKVRAFGFFCTKRTFPHNLSFLKHLTMLLALQVKELIQARQSFSNDQARILRTPRSVGLVRPN